MLTHNLRRRAQLFSTYATVGLNATNIRDISCVLGWTPTAGTTYNVYKGATLLASGLSTNSYTVTGLVKSTTYTFYVATVSNSIEGPKASITLTTSVAMDPYFSSVSLLLHGEAIADSSSHANTITAAGAAGISGSNYYTSYNSLFFPGDVSSYMTIANHSSLALGSSDFTLEGWILVTATNSRRIFTLNSSVSQNTMGLGLSVSNSLQLTMCNSAGTIVVDAYSAGGLIAANVAWYHVAVVRTAGFVKVYLNGQQVISAALTAALYAGTVHKIGICGNNTNPFSGFIDEVRLTKAARYTGNFSVPSVPFPNL